jgi:hypothetical protein
MDKNRAIVVRQILEETLAYMGSYYSNHFSFSIRFEADDTSAARDTAHFQRIMQLLKLPKARELVLKSNDESPTWTVRGLVQDLGRKISEVEGRTLAIGHYAGHGDIDAGMPLFFASPSTRRRLFSFEKALGDLFEDPLINFPTFENTDVILIIDSCYSGQCTREFGRAGRSVEIISSVSANQQAFGNASDRARAQNRTFTSQLADSIALRVDHGDPSLSFAEIIEELRRKTHPDCSPAYQLKVGRVGIRVPVPGQAGLPVHLKEFTGHCRTSSSRSAGEGSTPTPASPHLNAVFTIYLEDGASSGNTKRLVDWIHSLNPDVGVELTGVYASRSTVIILDTPWRIWAQLNGYPGFTFVCESFGRNMLPGIVGQQLPTIKKENVPFKGKRRSGLQKY